MSSADRRARYIAEAEAARASGTSPNRHRLPGFFVLALDATGSMASLIDEAKRSLTTIVNRLYEEANARVRIQLYVYRDYDVPHAVCEHSPASEDAQALVRWLDQVRTHGGGANEGEAIETVLEALAAGEGPSAVLIAGDEPSNPRADLDARGRRDTRTASDWARQLGQRGVPVHTFVVGQDPRTIGDFAELARLSGGQSGRLDGSAAMIDMAVMAMLSSLKGADAVRGYMERHALSDNSRRFGQLLLTGPGTSKKK